MQKRPVLSLFISLFVCGLCWFSGGDVAGQHSKLNPISEPAPEEFRTTFREGPGRDFSTGPLWTWNDRLSERQIRDTLRDLASQDVKQVWVHPRPGLMTPYLSEEWFARWKEALDEAKKLDMNVWIYDENSYPSGFAGGFVPEAMPDSRGMGLKFEEVEKLDRLDENVRYVFRVENETRYVDITAEAKAAGTLRPLPGGETYLIGRVHMTPAGPWFGGTWYVDLLKKGVTEKFIAITFDAYKNVPEIRKEFGSRVPGIFTDEPHPAGSYVGTWVTWNDEIPGAFEKMFGYSLIDHLPSLHKPVGDWRKVRHDYHKLILELFVERWARPCFLWCEENNLEFTGHYWEHGWPGTTHGPDNMAMYAWHQRPAIDILMNQYSGHVNGQFGNVRSVRELASVANQLGHSRTLCELYGAGGWDLRFEDMKRQADWIQALGVNTINEHLSYVTIRGARKRDHPQSFSYHAPWWEGYHVLARRNTRLQYALSQGRQVNDILVIEPTTTAWMYQSDAKLGQLGQRFQDFLNQCEALNIEYDLGSEDIIARLGSVKDGKLVVGQAAYRYIVFPPGMENIEAKTLSLVTEAQKSGAHVLCCHVPHYVDGAAADLSGRDFVMHAAALRALFFANPERIVPDAVNFTSSEEGAMKVVTGVSADGGTVYHHRRKLGDLDILFLTNVSNDESAGGWVQSLKSSVEIWNPDTGDIAPYPFEKANSDASAEVAPRYDMKFRYELPPCGSALFVLSSEPGDPFAAAEKEETAFSPLDETKVERLEPNVLTLDYVDVRVKNETLENTYFHRANHWVFEKNGRDIGLSRNPWDNGVQFKDELVTKKFPGDSGFTVTYQFAVAGRVPDDLHMVVERADLYDIKCNGRAVAVRPDSWWLDKSFHIVDLASAARVGENEVTLAAGPMTVYHEIEPAYLRGAFSLEATGRGFLVVPPKPLQLRTPQPRRRIVVHSNEPERVSWLTKGIGFGAGAARPGDAAPFLAFDFGEDRSVAQIEIWNYNERNLTKRGVKDMMIFSSPTPDPNDPNRTLWSRAVLREGSSGGPQRVFRTEERDAPKHRYMIFRIDSNHGGTTYPVPETQWNEAKNRDNAFVGLAEVRFFTRDDSGNVEPIEHVGIAAKSSELVQATHDRKAEYVLDGSGLEPYVVRQGWNRQGMPFYSAGVSYTQKFDLGTKEPGKTYFVRLPDSPDGWYGATAKVVVGGNVCGYVTSAPWQVDVTQFVTSGENTVEVVVIGTPKNLLGPHHLGKVRGTAWPGMFWNAPDVPPPGDSYDTIGYGLFEPFSLVTQ